MSISRQHVPNEAQWKRLTYVVFDAPSVPGGLVARLDAAKKNAFGGRYGNGSRSWTHLVPFMYRGPTYGLARLRKAASSNGVQRQGPYHPTVSTYASPTECPSHVEDELKRVQVCAVLWPYAEMLRIPATKLPILLYCGRAMLPVYAAPTKCPVLTSRMVVPGRRGRGIDAQEGERYWATGYWAPGAIRTVWY
eukprot:2658272-Rhodomonas_salina.1